MLQVIDNHQSITTLDLLRLVNQARESHNENPIANSDFIKRVEDELEGELGKREISVNPSGGRPAHYHNLTLEQAMLVGMRESKAVRRTVLAKLKELEAGQHQIPQTYSEALQLAADLAKKVEQDKPKVEFFDRVVEQDNLHTATQVGAMLGMSARALNQRLESLHFYNKSVKRTRMFRSWVLDQGYGVTKVVEGGYTQSLFTLKGVDYIVQLFSPEIDAGLHRALAHVE